MTTTEASTSFIIETTVSKAMFGSITYPVEINVENVKLNEHRPLAVAELGFIRLRNTNEDLSEMDGFVWYLPADQKVIIAIGYRSSKVGDRSLSPFIVGEFPAKKSER
ncbi:MAG: hypothetical protein H0W78_18000 [Planctomycetes bacterium]|nr:hypothetical protein [Planctomycetota bacterium]